MQSHYAETGNLHLNGTGYKPKAGDVFFMSSSKYPEGGAHTGFVLSFDEATNSVYTIEGNSGDAVKVLKHKLSEFYSFGSNGGTTYGVKPLNYDNNDGRIV